jgi:hypothetical protein
VLHGVTYFLEAEFSAYTMRRTAELQLGITYDLSYETRGCIWSYSDYRIFFSPARPN